jgi:hypothetical protein
MQIRLTLALALTAGMLSTAAIAQSQEDQQACMNDAFRVCSATIPDRARTTACMVQNKSQLSAACQVVMDKYASTINAPAPTTAVAVKPAKPMMSKPAAIRTAVNTTRPGKPLNILMR